MTIIEDLKKITQGLLYIGESEFAFEAMNFGKIDSNKLQQKIVADYGSNAAIKAIAINDFFANYLYRLNKSGDEVLAKDAERYTAMQHFIATNFATAVVYKVGAVKVGVYIVCTTKNNDTFILKTFTVET